MDHAWTQRELVSELTREESSLARATPHSDLSNPADHPDPLTERTVRYYRTQGLLDPPAGWTGNKPLFSRRHLLQLLALRRLQAAGWNLRQIRTWMQDANDDSLRRVIAGDTDDTPVHPPETADHASKVARARSHHWKAPLAIAAGPATRRDEATVPVRTTRVAPGVYLLVDPDAASELSTEELATAALRVRRVLGEVAGETRPIEDERTPKKKEEKGRRSEDE